MTLRKTLLTVAAVLIAGCDRSPPADNAPAEAIPAAPSARAPYTVDVAGFEGPTGEEGYIVVAIEARDGHKINKEYPQKVVLDAPPDGMHLPLRTMKLSDGALDGDQRLVFSVPAIARRAGEYTVAGTVRLSVCNDGQCRVEKEPMSARVVAQ